MTSSPITAQPLLRLGRMELTPALRQLQPGSSPADLVVTATVTAPQEPPPSPSGWQTAWADAVREAAHLGVDRHTAHTLIAGAGAAPVPGGTRIVVAARGEVLLSQWLPPGPDPGATSVRVGPLPHLRDVAAVAARQPAYVVLLADRHGTDIVGHQAGRDSPSSRVTVGNRPGLQPDPDPDRPPGLLHGERHLTDREPVSGGQQNAAFIAGRVAEAAGAVGAHIVIGTGDEHILAAVESHLPDALRPVATVPGGRGPDGLDSHVRDAVGIALDEATAAAIRALGGQVAERAAASPAAAVRGLAAVAEQLAEQQVAALLLAASDLRADAEVGSQPGYWLGTSPTEFLLGDPGTGVQVPPDDGLVWAALHQDAIVVELPEGAGALAGQPVAALLRRGAAA
jgi:Bacterial archaeo-eukaryotic release factor family 2